MASILENNFIYVITLYTAVTLSFNLSFALSRNHRHASSSWAPKIAHTFRANLVLSALLPIHTSRSNGGHCAEFYRDGMVLAEAVVFALREVRRRKLLPDITLGYEIRDTCNSVAVSQRHTLDLMQEQNWIFNGKCNDSSITGSRQKVIAVVGAGNSELSIAVNRVLSAFDIPQIGFASTSRFLSDKLRFPSFFRVVPPDSFQANALVALFQKFDWNYASLLFSDGDYGRPMAESFKSVAKARGICIGFERLVPIKINQTMADTIVKELTLQLKLEIIVILLPELDAKTILKAMMKSGISNKTLIASDSWSKSFESYSDLELSTILKGTLGFANHDVRVKEFEEYFLALKPNTNTWNPWFNETWERLFDCKILNLPDYINKTFRKPHGLQKKPCNLQRQKLKRGQFTAFHRVLNVINAVFAIANGVRESCLVRDGASSNQLNSSCLSTINPSKLLGKLKGLKFRGYYGADIVFDRNGDVKGKYDLINILPNLVVKSVGTWEERKTEMFRVNASKIVWRSGQQSPPNGVCAQSCPPGFYRRPLKRDPRCCWECRLCHQGTISNKSGATACVSCGDHLMPNLNRTACIFIPVNYLNWQSSWTVSIVVVALISLLLLTFVVVLFVRYFNTPVVKSSNRELSFLLCVGLLVTFLVPFAFVGKPTRIKCTVSQIMFCVGSALALSAMFAKTLRIVLVFELHYGSRCKWLLKNKYVIALTLVLTFAELTYCLLWVAVNPPDVKVIQLTYTIRFMICNFDERWYAGSHLLLITLSLVCTGLAVKGRKLPKNFNEVKHIILSMFTFNIIWVVFMGAQYGASLQYDARINCFAIIISSLMILVLLFGPKAFLILFRPHLNTKEGFQEEARRYTFRHSNVNTLDVDGTGSSRSVSTMTSLRRGSLPKSPLSANHGLRMGRFLSVPNDLPVHERKRTLTFHALSDTVSMKKECSTLRGSAGTSLQKSLTNSLKGSTTTTNPEASSEMIQIPIKITVPRDDPSNTYYRQTTSSIKQVTKYGRRPFDRKCSGRTDNVSNFRRLRCELCNQTIKESFSQSLPNFLVVLNGSSEMVVCASDLEQTKLSFGDEHARETIL